MGIQDAFFFLFACTLIKGCLSFADGVGTVMTARFRLPAGRRSDVGESEAARDRSSLQVVCNVLLLDNTVQEFRANVSQRARTSSALCFGRFSPFGFSHKGLTCML